MSRIFLSHSSLDTREAVALKQWLAEQDPPLANEIFLDVDPSSGIQTGTRWKDALRRANARCEAVICLLSPNWEASQECRVEYRTAENLNKQIFMARLKSTGDDLTSEWQRCDLFGDGPKTRVDIGGGPPVEFGTEGLYRLRDGIRGAGIGAESFVWPPPADPGRAPYRGWEPLEEIDAAVFFGRDAQIVKALDAMRGIRMSGINALFVVLGPSGTGKSSFLRAGVMPRLRREDRRFVLLDIVRPERNVLAGDSGFAQAIARTRATFGLSQPSLGEIKAACGNGDVSAVAGWLAELRHEAAARLVNRGGADKDAPAAPTLVLPLDQAEELFSADSGDSADVFLRLLAGVIEQLNASEIGLAVAATIRTDRYEVMQTHPALADVGTLLFDELKPMPSTQFKEVITGPGRRATEAGRPLSIAPDLVDRLLADAAEGADSLPMLALTMSRLYTDYGSTGELTLAHYESMGGMRRVVQTEIDDVLSSDQQKRAGELEALRAAFIPWLATVNPENDQPMRRVARWSDLPEGSRPLIDALVGKRLMVKDTRDGETVVEVALESLLRQWDELAGWLRHQRKDLKDADELERSATGWTANAQDPAWLLSGTRLTDAESLSNTTGFRQRLAATADYLAASRDAENRRLAAEDEQRQAELRAAQERQATAEAHTATLRKRSRILRAVLAVTAVVAVVAAVGFVRANAANNEAQRQFREATSGRLTADAQGIFAGTRPGNDARAMQQLLAARSLTERPDDSTLYDAVIAKEDLGKVFEPGSAFDVAYSSDGRVLANSAAGGRVDFWDPRAGKRIGELETGDSGGLSGIAFSPDGRVLTTVGIEGAIRSWDAATRESVGAASTVPGEITSFALSPDGQRLAIGGDDGALRLWDMQRTTQLGPPVQTGSEDARVAFSPDGRYVAAGVHDGSVWLWDTQNQTSARQLTGHAYPITDVAFSPDGRRLASGSFDRTIRLWDAETGTPVGKPLELTREVLAIAFSPDGKRLASGAQGSVLMWDVDSGKTIGEAFDGHAGLIFAVAFDPDGRHVASTATDGTLRIWDTAPIEPIAGRSVALSPDGRRMAVGNGDGTISLYDPDTRKTVGAPFGDPGEPKATLFSPDGRRLLSIGSRLQLWDTERAQAVTIDIDIGRGAVAFSEDGRRLLIAGRDVQAWDAETGQPVGPVITTGETADVKDVGYMSDGKQVEVIYGNDRLKVWDAATGEERLNSELPITLGVNAASIGRGGAYVAGGILGQVSFFAAGSVDSRNKHSAGHVGIVTATTVSPDGRQAATAGRDQTVRLWDIEDAGAFGKPLTGIGDPIENVSLSSDGRFVAAATEEGKVHVWPASATAADLCSKLTANMSEKQWDEWVSPEIDYIKSCPDLPVAPD